MIGLICAYASRFFSIAAKSGRLRHCASLTSRRSSFTDAVENYLGFPDAINGLDLADKLEKQAHRHTSLIFQARIGW